MVVLRKALVPVEPDLAGFDPALRRGLDRVNAKVSSERLGSKIGDDIGNGVQKKTRSVGDKINNALRALNIEEINVGASPREALAAIDRVQDELRRLGATATTAEVRVQTQEADRGLEGLKRRIGSAGEEGGKGFAARFGGRVGPLLASVPVSPPLLAGLGAAGAAGAPVFASALASGLAGGTALGIFGIGMMGLAKDQVIIDAGRQAGDRFMGGLQREASRALRGPVLGLLDELGAASDKATRRLGQGFDAVAPNITSFGSKVMGVASRGLDAFVSVTEQSGPALDGLGDAIVLIGDGVTYFVQNLADGGPEAADNLRLIAGATADLLKYTSNTLDALNKLASNEWITGPLLPLLRKHYKGAADEAGGLTGKLNEQGPAASRTGGALRNMGEDARFASVTADTLKDAQDDLTTAQKGLQASLDTLAPSQRQSTDLTNNLKKAADLMYGSAMRGADANQAWEESWDNLSASVKANGRSLDVHTEKGRTNRDSLKNLLKANNDLYYANIDAGMSVDQARKKHEQRTQAVIKEAGKLRINKGETDSLIKTYGRIPPRKATDLVLAGVERVADALLDLAAIQLHLAKGTKLPADLSRRLSRAQYGMPDTKRAMGGPLPGYSGTDRSDNTIYAGTPGEWVIQRPTVRRIEREHGQGAMAYLNRYGELPLSSLDHHASGGLVRARRANWGNDLSYKITTAMTKVMSDREAISKVPFGNFGNWPSSPGAQRGDSGVWRKIVQLIRSTGPLSGSFGNGYRPGDPKWHGSGRAVDWMGYNQDALSRFLIARKPLEFIHRTNKRDYAFTRGRDKGSFNNALMEAHRDHIHAAFGEGGEIPEHVVGVGASGRRYEFGERGPEHVATSGNMTEMIALQRAILDAILGDGARLAGALRSNQRTVQRTARSLGRGGI